MSLLFLNPVDLLSCSYVSRRFRMLVKTFLSTHYQAEYLQDIVCHGCGSFYFPLRNSNNPLTIAGNLLATLELDYPLSVFHSFCCNNCKRSKQYKYSICKMPYDQYYHLIYVFHTGRNIIYYDYEYTSYFHNLVRQIGQL